MVFDNGKRKMAKVIIIGKDRDTSGVIMIAAEESLWSTEVPHLSLPFLMIYRGVARLFMFLLSVPLCRKTRL